MQVVKVAEVIVVVVVRQLAIVTNYLDAEIVIIAILASWVEIGGSLRSSSTSSSRGSSISKSNGSAVGKAWLRAVLLTQP